MISCGLSKCQNRDIFLVFYDIPQCLFVCFLWGGGGLVYLFIYLFIFHLLWRFGFFFSCHFLMKRMCQNSSLFFLTLWNTIVGGRREREKEEGKWISWNKFTWIKMCTLQILLWSKVSYIIIYSPNIRIWMFSYLLLSVLRLQVSRICWMFLLKLVYFFFFYR